MEIAVLLVGLAVTVLVVTALADRIDVPAPLVLVVAGVGVSFVPGVPRSSWSPRWCCSGCCRRCSTPPRSRPRWSTSTRTGARSCCCRSASSCSPPSAWPRSCTSWCPASAGPRPSRSARSWPHRTPWPRPPIGRRIGLPRRVVTILEGESLLNDATALVSLRTAIAAARHHHGLGGGPRLRRRRGRWGARGRGVLRRGREGAAPRHRPAHGHRDLARGAVRRLPRRRGDPRLRDHRRRHRRAPARPPGTGAAERAVPHRRAGELAHDRVPAGERRLPPHRAAGGRHPRRRPRERARRWPHRPGVRPDAGRRHRAAAGVGLPGALPAGAARGRPRHRRPCRRSPPPSCSGGRACAASSRWPRRS